MTVKVNALEFGKLMHDGRHIACPLCGRPLRTNGSFELQCEKCGQLWHSLGIDYRQGSEVFRLRRAAV